MLVRAMEALAIEENGFVEVRSPQATRPWQHVLEPLSGYLLLGAKLLQGSNAVNGEAFNFGPDSSVNQTVAELLNAMSARWAKIKWHSPDGSENSGQEAQLLKLSCDKALFYLKWHAIMVFSETVDFTVDWYRTCYKGEEHMYDYSVSQINKYCKIALSKGAIWTAKI